ncbi:MAG: hypothetical protein VYD19_07095, partial [Myxococcota bacterium]|nr:hypothetical protein [Myxococcota bacterium]
MRQSKATFRSSRHWLASLALFTLTACDGEEATREEPPSPPSAYDMITAPEADQGAEPDMAPPLWSSPGAEGACVPNPSFEALLPILNGGRTHPTGRGEQASAYDPCNGRIILFGGNDFQPEECADFG